MSSSSQLRILLTLATFAAAACVLLVGGVAAESALEFQDHDRGNRDRRSLLSYSYGLPPNTPRHAPPPPPPKRKPPPPRPQTCTYKPSICKSRWQPGPNCCAGKCINIKTNVHHCGRCGKVCRWGFSCCNGKCIDLLNDPQNCGRCGTKCRYSAGRKGKCQFGLCEYGH
ncbi:hypothetical protein R1flu_006334 [Riccia fluitans]|uniref:Stigma-specific Stig1 family protein n=1 Tax=Riccia fluitans TaxID=41844 RepID=A0ABD1YWK0_9MARC